MPTASSAYSSTVRSADRPSGFVGRDVDPDLTSCAPPASRKPSIVHFSGTWNPDEQSSVRRALQAAERMFRLDDSNRVPPFGATWVCVRDAVNGRTIYLAHRLGYTDVFRAKSAEELSTGICEYALSL